MAEFEDSVERIEALISSSSSRMQRKFLETVNEIKSQATLASLIELLEQGRIDEAVVNAEIAANNLATGWTDSFVSSAQATSAFIGQSINVLVSFDQTNFRAVEQMRQATLRLVRNFTTEQRLVTRLALVEGIRRGLNPRQQALLFQRSIGLNEAQVRAIYRFRDLLERNSARSLTYQLRDQRFDQTIQRHINTGKPLSDAQIDRMVDRYAAKQLRHRAQVIARTESLRAVHQANDEAFQQALDSGLVEDLSQQWHTANDGRVRIPAHTFMNKQVRPFGQRFRSGIGNLLRYPGDDAAPPEDSIQCRCVKTTRFTADIEDAA